MNPAPDLLAANTFLSILDEGASAFCFRVFDDDENRKDRTLAGKYNGDFTKLAHALTVANEKGCGVFAVVNEGGQDAASITHVRAVFADLDGAPLDPILACDLEPHVIVESSPGKFHAYWRVDDLPLADFEGVQRAIAAEFNSDPSVIDLPRVMRLPGFWHRKGAPFQSRIIHESGAQPYSAATITSRWPADAVPARHEAQATLGQVVEINRHASVLKETRFLAHDVQQGHITREEALNTMRTRVADGRYSRHIPDDEIVRALDGALHKMPVAPAPAEPAAPRADLADTLGAAAVTFTNAEFDAAATPHPHAFMSPDQRRGLFPEGEVTILGAPGREGKTTIVTCVAKHYALGWPLAGMAPTDIRAVMIYSAEDDRAQYARKFQAQRARLSDADAARLQANVIVPDLHGEALSAWREVVRLEARQPVPGPILDPLIATIRALQARDCPLGMVIFETASTLSDAEEDNVGLRVLVAALKRIGKATGVAVVLTHHTSQESATRLPTLDLSESAFRGGTALVNNARQTLLAVNLGSAFDPFPDADARTVLRDMVARGERERITLVACLSSSKSAEPAPLFFRWEDVDPYGPRAVEVDVKGDIAGKSWRGVHKMLAGAKAEASADRKAEKEQANVRIAVRAVCDLAEAGQTPTAAKVSAKCGRNPGWAKPYLAAAVELGDLVRSTEQLPRTRGMTDVYRPPAVDSLGDSTAPWMKSRSEDK